MTATRIARFTPVRLLTTLALAMALAVTLLVGDSLGPTTSRASAHVISAFKADHAADWAHSRQGSPYQYGATGPHRFDCSGLTRWAYARVGKWLPHSSAAQAGKVDRISRRNARRGDLVFFYGYGGVYHVGVWVGHGEFWHAPYSGTRVRKDHLWTSHVFFGRVR